MAKGYWIAHVDVNDDEAYKPMRRQSGIFENTAGVRGARRQVRCPEGGRTATW